MGHPTAHEAMAALHARFEGVRTEVGEDGLLLVTPTAQTPDLSPSDVAAVLVGGGFSLDYLEPVNPSLEEVFLTLTQELGLAQGEEDA